MSNFNRLVDTVDTYQALATENYNRIRKLAEELADGLCGFMGATDGSCVHLVPPVGQFTPRAHGDEAFSIPPRGFRPLGPVAFGLAVRVSRGTDWLRVTIECHKTGDKFRVRLLEGKEYEIELPLADHNPDPLYQLIYDHVYDWFETRIKKYRDGDSGSREIGFDFADPESPPNLAANA